jgi:salicylate hydroxylase
MAEASSTLKPFTISIIGGGLAGLLLGIGLSTRGISIRIYEAAADFTETSAGIGFGPNAVRAMALLDPRIYSAYSTLKTENGWLSKRDTWFDFRRGMEDNPELVAEVKMGGEAGNVLRARFMEELVKLLPEKCVEFRKTLLGIEELHEGVKLLFRDGTTDLADAVVGCDGIRSVMRKVLLGDEHPASKAVFTNMCVYRGLIGMSSAISTVGEELAINSQIYMGKDASVVTYPIENESVLNLVAFRRKDVWEAEKWIAESTNEEMLGDFEALGEVTQKLLKVGPF